MTSRKHILIVDNDIGLQESLTVLLQSQHLDVTTCPLTDYEKYQYKKPDVAIIDFPYKKDKSKIEKVIAALKRKYNLPILLKSTDNNLREMAICIGGNDFLAEPFDISEFLEKIRVLCAEV